MNQLHSKNACSSKQFTSSDKNLNEQKESTSNNLSSMVTSFNIKDYSSQSIYHPSIMWPYSSPLIFPSPLIQSSSMAHSVVHQSSSSMVHQSSSPMVYQSSSSVVHQSSSPVVYQSSSQIIHQSLSGNESSFENESSSGNESSSENENFFSENEESFQASKDFYSQESIEKYVSTL